MATATPALPAGPWRRLAALILAQSERSGLGVGGRLPTERQLAADLGVSRSAIRHAMQVLEADGRVSREVGRGTFLRDQAPGGAAGFDAFAGLDDVGPADVMAVRRLIEPQVMPLAVAWATARDFEEMDRCLAGGDAAQTYEEFEVWDLALHRCLFAASHSQLLMRMATVIESARNGLAWGNLKRRSDTPARRDAYRRDHAELVAALRLRDAERAVEAMRAHLARVELNLLGGMSR
jgi:DNA-binding FadR family transcriptional regulator